MTERGKEGVQQERARLYVDKTPAETHPRKQTLDTMDSISPEEQAVLDQFAEITNYDKETEGTKVARLLTVCNWNLETAIARYFDNDFPQLFDELQSQPPTSISSDSNYINNINNNNNNNDNENDINLRPPVPIPPVHSISPNNFMLPYPDDLFLPKLQRAMPINNKWKFQAGLINSRKSTFKYKFLTPIVFLLMLMPKVLLLLGYGLNKLFGNFAPKLFRILGLREEDDDFPAQPFYNSIEDISTYDVNKYIETVINKEIDLPIFKGEFNDAFNEARSNLQWLCIVLFNSKAIESSNKLINQVLTNESFVDFIKKNNVVLYVGDVAYPEPFEVGQSYSAFGIPYLSLIANVSASGLTHPEFSIVCKYNKLLQNHPNTSKLCKRLNKIVEKYEPQLVTQRYDKQEADYSRYLREEQDNAYQESLLKDMEREREKQKKLEAEKERQEKERREALELQQAIEKRKEYLIRYINDKYIRNTDDWQRGEFTTIQFRTHEGQRFIRKFSKDETTLDIFMFVSSKKLIEEFINDTEEEKELNSEDDVLSFLKKYSFKFADDGKTINSFSFDLISPMPRLRLQPDGKSLNELKEIWPNGSLLIEKNEDEEDSEGEEDEEDNDTGND